MCIQTITSFALHSGNAVWILSQSSVIYHSKHGADLSLSWSHRALLCDAELSSDRLHPLHADLLQITIWLTPAGTVDEGGVKQPAYLNFDIALLGPPAANQMEVRVLPS